MIVDRFSGALESSVDGPMFDLVIEMVIYNDSVGTIVIVVVGIATCNVYGVNICGSYVKKSSNSRTREAFILLRKFTVI